MTWYRIIETDNFGGDYPDEKFVTLPLLTEAHAHTIANAINNCLCDHPCASRFWQVVKDGYQLQPGFEP